MYRKYLLTSNAVGNAADSDRLIDAAVLLGNDSAFKSLISLTVAFLNANGNANCVADVHLRQFRLHILLAKRFDEIHSDILLSLQTFIPGMPAADHPD